MAQALQEMNKSKLEHKALEDLEVLTHLVMHFGAISEEGHNKKMVNNKISKGLKTYLKSLNHFSQWEITSRKVNSQSNNKVQLKERIFM
jgi:ABC-type oligopeptide transport system ATPase subunit